MTRQPCIGTTPEHARTRQRHFAEQRRQALGCINAGWNANRQLTGVLAVVEHDVLAGIQFDEHTLRRLRRRPWIVDFLKPDWKPRRQLTLRELCGRYRKGVLIELVRGCCSHCSSWYPDLTYGHLAAIMLPSGI